MVGYDGKTYEVLCTYRDIVRSSIFSKRDLFFIAGDGTTILSIGTQESPVEEYKLWDDPDFEWVTEYTELNILPIPIEYEFFNYQENLDNPTLDSMYSLYWDELEELSDKMDMIFVYDERDDVSW